MENQNAKKSQNLGVYKKQDFEAYVTWRSMPSFLRGQPRHVLEKSGIDDELAMSLLEMRTQTEFAERFGIKDLGTLTEWNKKIEEAGLLQYINRWARKLTPNVIYALYRSASKDGKSAEVKAWLENIEGM